MTQIAMMKEKLGAQLELIKKQLVDLQVRVHLSVLFFFFIFTYFFPFAERVQGSFEANSSTAEWWR